MAARPQPATGRRPTDPGAGRRPQRAGARRGPGVHRRGLRLSGELAAALTAIRPRSISGRFWHQGAAGRALTSFADPARSAGRYHQLGGPGVWYASDQEQACWAELMRHFLDAELDPFEVLRRVGRVRVVNLHVLDLTDPDVRAAVGLTEADLIGDDDSHTQTVAAAAAAAGFAGILAPSAALPGRRTLVVFAAGTAAITEESSTVRQPPPRLADLLRAIRLRHDTPAAIRDFLASLAAAGSATIRRRR